MREILFRGKVKNTNEWQYGDLRHWTKKSVGIHHQELHTTLRVIPDTVGQYTGLTDKNGKKIFEGDIVRHHNDCPNPEGKEKGVVFWDEKYCSWRRTSNGAFHHGIVDTYRMSHDCVYEVIGNITDNPELLKGGG